MHVLKVLTSFAGDDAGCLVLDLLRRWAPGDITVSLAVFKARGALEGRLREQVARLGGGVWAVEASWWRGTGAVTDFARRCGADILHAHSLQADWATRAAAASLGKPYFVTEQLLYGATGMNPLAERAVRRWYRTRHLGARSTVIATSDWGRAQLVRHGVPPDRIAAIRSGVCLEEWKMVDRAGRTAARERVRVPDKAYPVVLFQGEFSAHSAAELALLSYAQLSRANGFDPRRGALVMAGDGPLKPRLQAMAAELDLIDRVAFVSDAASVAAGYRAAHLLLHPAPEEAFGLPVARALACGLGVVVRDGTGASELLPPPPYVRRVESEDPRLWAIAIEDAALEYATGKTRARNHLRRHAERTVDIAATARAYLRQYWNAMGG
jgi:glycosyltransferase involved in cell wall biosynthesis